MPINKIPYKQLNGTEIDARFLRKDQADASTGKITANGFDANNNEITHVADATVNTSAPSWGQVKNLIVKGSYGGRITGYIKGGDSNPYRHNNTNDVTVSSTSPLTTGLVTAPLLYLVIADYTVNSTTYVANSIVGVYGTGPFTHFCDNTLGTFNASSAAADPGGAMTSIEYQIACSSMAGDVIPNQPSNYASWTEGASFKWNPDYDTGATADNTGRWEPIGLPMIPVASKAQQGIMQAGDGVAISGGTISIDVPTGSCLKYYGSTSPNKTLGLDYYSQHFTVSTNSLQIKYDVTYLDVNASGITLKDSGVAAGTYYKVVVDAKGRITSGTAYATNFAADVNSVVKKMTTERFILASSLTGAGQTATIILSSAPNAPSTNPRQDILLAINGVIIDNNSTIDAYSLTNGNATITLKRDGIGYNLDTTDVITVTYLPA